MKSTIIILSLLFASIFSIQAQTEKQFNTGNVSLYLCEQYSNEKGDAMGNFTGFTGTRGTQKFTIVARIQGFTPNVVHQLELKIVNPAQKNILKNEKVPFTLKSNMSLQNHTDNVTATFDTEGIYQIQAWIDGKLIQYLNFNVGSKVAKNKGMGNVAMVVCNNYDSDNNNITGIYTGIKTPKDTRLSLLTRFQDFPLNVANKAFIKLITPSGKDLLNQKELIITLGDNAGTFFHTSNMTVPLLETGIYQFQSYVNGKMVQYLNFRVGEN